MEIIYKRVRKRERGREKDVEYCSELLFLFLKGMMGALAPFSYIVLSKAQLCIVCKVVTLHSFCKYFFSNKVVLIVTTIYLSVGVGPRIGLFNWEKLECFCSIVYCLIFLVWLFSFNWYESASLSLVSQAAMRKQ